MAGRIVIGPHYGQRGRFRQAIQRHPTNLPRIRLPELDFFDYRGQSTVRVEEQKKLKKRARALRRGDSHRRAEPVAAPQLARFRWSLCKRPPSLAASVRVLSVPKTRPLCFPKLASCKARLDVRAERCMCQRRANIAAQGSPNAYLRNEHRCDENGIKVSADFTGGPRGRIAEGWDLLSHNAILP